jgi:hypothetical protein
MAKSEASSPLIIIIIIIIIIICSTPVFINNQSWPNTAKHKKNNTKYKYKYIKINKQNIKESKHTTGTINVLLSAIFNYLHLKH